MKTLRLLHRQEQMEAHREVFSRTIAKEYMQLVTDGKWSEREYWDHLPGLWKSWLKDRPIR